LLHLVGFFYIILPTLTIHGQTQIKSLTLLILIVTLNLFGDERSL
jgi:hypothetical protein